MKKMGENETITEMDKWKLHSQIAQLLARSRARELKKVMDGERHKWALKYIYIFLFIYTYILFTRTHTQPKRECHKVAELCCEDALRSRYTPFQAPIFGRFSFCFSVFMTRNDCSNAYRLLATGIVKDTPPYAFWVSIRHSHKTGFLDPLIYGVCEWEWVASLPFENPIIHHIDHKAGYAFELRILKYSMLSHFKPLLFYHSDLSREGNG